MPIPGASCGKPCTKPLVEALGFTSIEGPFSLRPDELGEEPTLRFEYGELDQVIGVPSVTLTYMPEADPVAWQRIHFFFDWSTGSPKIIAISHWWHTP